jgi:hypothetical protein
MADVVETIEFDKDLPERISRGLEDWLFNKITSEYPDINWDNLEINGISVTILN